MRRDLARSRAEAQELISDSKVLVAGMPALKPATLGRDGNVEYLLWLRKGEDGVELEVPS